MHSATKWISSKKGFLCCFCTLMHISRPHKINNKKSCHPVVDTAHSLALLMALVSNLPHRKLRGKWLYIIFLFCKFSLFFHFSQCCASHTLTLVFIKLYNKWCNDDTSCARARDGVCMCMCKTRCLFCRAKRPP